MTTEGFTGFVAIDKPTGPSSAQAVARVRRRLAAKAGHSGTLDPMASGLLVVAVGSATRLLRYLSSAKRYLVTVRFGLRTDTDDVSGKVIGESKVPDDLHRAVDSILACHVGQVSQAAPAFSALKHRGQPLYKYARAGCKVEPKIRKVYIERIDLLGQSGGDSAQVRLDVRCGPGVYMRSLARDLGETLGCGATMEALRRIECNGLSVADAQPLEGDQPLRIKEPLEMLSQLPRCALSERQADHLLHGQQVKVGLQADGKCAAVSAAGILLGIARAEQGLLRPECMLAVR